jgi:hypothetical protein
VNSRAVLTICLTGALALPYPGWSQQVSGPKSNLVQGAGGLKIVVIQGEGATNNIRTKAVTLPVVEVRDDNDKPVANAEVIFQLPAAGPGGVFNGWMRNQTVRSNAQGQAGADGLTPNDEEGRFNIKVTATSGTKTGSVIIGQSNVRGAGGAQAKSGRKTLWIVLGVIAVGGIAGGVAATRGDSNTTTVVTVPVTITAGPVTVGNPR